MKPNRLGLVLVLAISGLVAFAAEKMTVAPGLTNSYDVVQSPVLKVYSAKEGKHRFVAYLVKWKDSEVIVSDPLAKSDYKVGDTISFLAQKITVEQKDSGTVDSLAFTLGRPPAKYSSSH
jgi:hypothetical protein